MSETVAFQCPDALLHRFERKGGSQDTHYCPGCGHGMVHKYVAEAIDKLGVKDRTIFISPVGCSVFAYYYFDVGNSQAAHGRAPDNAYGAGFEERFVAVADHAIVDAVAAASRPRGLKVVSRDREVTGRSRQLGARVAGPAELLGRRGR